MDDLLTGTDAVIITTSKMLKQVFIELMEEQGIIVRAKGDEPLIPDELPTRLAKKYMGKKGYACTAYSSFKDLMDLHKVRGVRKGKEKWFKVRDLDGIPDRV